MNNPALRQESRYEPAAVIPVKQESSILNWLKETGRLIPREQIETEGSLLDDEEISELMDVEDSDYDDDTSSDADLED